MSVRTHRTSRTAAAAAFAALVGVAGFTGAARAEVIGVTINNASVGDYTLTSVTVRRGPGVEGVFSYTPAQLIGVDLTDIAASGSSVVTQNLASLPPAGTRATMLEDNRLDTGLINPFSTGAPPEDAFEVTFLNPVINSDGADILVFELGGGDPTAFWVNNDRDNHRFNVVPGNFDTNLLTGVPFFQYTYANPEGGDNVNGLAALESTTGWDGAGSSGSLPVSGIALDLSDFGIAMGDMVTSLRWQTTATSTRLDAVYVAGLPAVPEPASLFLLTAAGLGLLTRRRTA